MTELALRTDTVTRDWVELMVPAAKLAEQVANTNFVPQGLRNDPAAIVGAILYGDEVGLGPMQSLAKIAVINGRPTLAAEAQRALILAAGHELWIVESSITRVTVAGRRRGSEQTSTVTWTMDDAKRAGLSGKQPYKIYPRQMLLARATAELARLVFADAIGGLYATEELEEGAGFDENGEITEPPKATTKRKRERVNTTAGVVTSAEPPTQVAAAPPPLPHELPVVEAETPAEPESPFVAPAPKPDKISPEQYTLANLLVGQLRERLTTVDDEVVPALRTEHVYSFIANKRKVDPEMLMESVGGYDEAGVLHWSPLREALTKDEISSLINRLQTYEQNLGGAEG